MKKKLKILVIFMLMALVLTGCRIGDTEYVWEGGLGLGSNIFSINGEECSYSKAMVYLCNYRNLYGMEYGVDLWECDFEEDSLEDYIKGVTLDELTRIMCMAQIAEQENIALDKDEKSKVSKAADEYYKSLSDEEIDFMDIKKSSVEDIYSEYALAMKLYTTLTKDIKTEVSDDDARVIDIMQIYVSGSENAAAVQAKLAAGGDFSSVAASYNEKDAVEINAARGDLPEEVEEVAFNLNDGQTSDMITTSDGYYFIKCVSKIVPDLTEANKANILVSRKEEQFNDKYNSFVDSSEFELNKDSWNDISIAENDDIKTSSFFEIYNKYFTE